MSGDDGAHAARFAVVTIEEGPGGIEQRLDAVEQLAMGDFAPKLAPEHLDWVEPGAVGWQGEQDEPPGRAAQHSLDFLILVRVGIVPGDGDCLAAMLGEERLKEFGDLASALVPPGDDHRLTRVPVR